MQNTSSPKHFRQEILKLCYYAFEFVTSRRQIYFHEPRLVQTLRTYCSLCHLGASTAADIECHCGKVPRGRMAHLGALGHTTCFLPLCLIVIVIKFHSFGYGHTQ
jgi:hypothetical protein